MIVDTVLKKFFGSKHDRDIKEIQPFVDKINEIEASLSGSSDEELMNKTNDFKQRVSNGEMPEELLCEAFAVVRKAGVDPNVFYELITTTMFSAPIYSYYGKNIATDIHTPPNFRSSLGLKDISQTIESAHGIGVPMPLAELVKSQIQQTIENGDQDLDWSCVARVAAKAAGLK